MTNPSIKLSKAQEQIVTQPIGGPIQVLGSSGTGKTRVLTERVRYILENIKKDGIIALNFTNKAAEEMKARLETSNKTFDRCWIATIHSVARRVVNSYAHTIGLSYDLHIYDKDHERKTIFLQSINRKMKSSEIQEFMNKFSKIKRELWTNDKIKEEYGDSTLNDYKNYQKELIRIRGIDFDDILVYAHKILIEQPWCGQIYRAKYKHICVDEAQKLNKAQYEFIKAFCAEKIKSLFMVGDPDQMIYSFNSSFKDYLCINFLKDFNPIELKLKENYRSSKAVIRLANTLRPSTQKEIDFALEGKCQIKKFHNEASEAQWICSEIEKILKMKTHSDIEGTISLDNMAVIARNRFIFKSLEKTLETKNINFHLKKTTPLLEPESKFGKILDFSIRLKLNPKDWISRNKLANILKVSETEKKDKSSYILLHFANQLSYKNDPFCKIKSETCRNVHSLDERQPDMPKLFETLETKMNKIPQKDLTEKEEKDLELSMRELENFKDLWLTFIERQPKGSLSAFINLIDLGKLIGKNKESESDTLMLSTVHTMKGLEKDIVFLMGMCEGIFPDYKASEKKLEEEKNNAFVAITRSKRWLYITYPKRREMPWGEIKNYSPSSFIPASFIPVEIVFDQNVAAKLSQKGNQSFQKNIEGHFSNPDSKLFLTPFSLLEHAGIDKKRLFDIPYKGKKWEEYPFKSYAEFDNEDTVEHIKNHFDKNISKSFLKGKLEDKKSKKKYPYLSKLGALLINSYIKNFDKLYDAVRDHFVWDRWSIINISECSMQDKEKFIRFWTVLLMKQIYNNQFGSFRTVHKLYNEQINKPFSEPLKVNPEHKKTEEKLREILEKCQLKPDGDLVACEIIYHAFFGGANRILNIYTLDKKDRIERRLKLYCVLIKSIIDLFFSEEKLYLPYIEKYAKYLHQRIQNKEHPKWRCGKIFILEEETGKVIDEISVAKIYEGGYGKIY